MVNHPIPQDITGFKFKLIGSITVKQFFYLLAAAILAYLMLILPIFVFIKVPIAATIALVGIALAFIPYDGRPIDVMLLNYIKTIPSENQYIYKKTGVDVSYLLSAPVSLPNQTITTKSKTVSYKTIPLPTKKEVLEKHEAEYVNSLKKFFSESTFKSPEEKKKEEGLPKVITNEKSQKVAEKPIDDSLAKKAAPDMVPIPAPSQPKPPSPPEMGVHEIEKKIRQLQEELGKSMAEKDILQKKFFELANQRQSEITYKPSQAQASSEQVETSHVRSISSQSTVTAGFPSLPDIPNIILGIIKDARGKVLQHIIVEVLDSNDNPVRAFKTNGLGQFASATPLSNGIYKMRFEDPKKQHDFDTVEIELTGKIFQPLEIISVDQRERLRRELFNAN